MTNFDHRHGYKPLNVPSSPHDVFRYFKSDTGIWIPHELRSCNRIIIYEWFIGAHPEDIKTIEYLRQVVEAIKENEQIYHTSNYERASKWREANPDKFKKYHEEYKR